MYTHIHKVMEVGVVYVQINELGKYNLLTIIYNYI